MGLFSSLRKSVVSAVVPVLVLCSATSQATTVQFQTSLGNIDVVLFDKTTPKTVENFMYYLNAGAYTNGVIHRSAKVLNTDKTERNFVIQGGGFRYTGSMPLVSVKTKDSVDNEPLYSNVRGTISMAKIPDNANSATSGWFFNMGENTFLDLDNGGFTVFGQVTPESLAVLDEIAAVKTFFATSSSPEFPLRNYTVDDYRNNVPVDEDNLVLVTDIVILDPSPNTQDAVTIVENPYYEPPAEELDKESGGGSLGGWYWGVLSLLMLVFIRRKTLG